MDPVSNLQVIACSHRQHRRDKTVLSCLVCSCVHNADADKTRHFCLVSVSGVNTTADKRVCHVSNYVYTTDADKTKLSCLVRIGVVNKPLYFR